MIKRKVGRLMNLTSAKEIASQWHGGQNSALYQFASSGKYVPENHLRYLQEIYQSLEPEYWSVNPAHMIHRDRRKLTSLKNYFVAKGEKIGIYTKWEKHPHYGYMVPFLDEQTDPKMIEKVEKLKLLARDGAAIACERKYTSEQPHEQRYRQDRKSPVRYYRTMEIGGSVDGTASQITDLFGVPATSEPGMYGVIRVTGDAGTLQQVQQEFGGSFDGKGDLMVAMYQHGGCPLHVGQPVKFSLGGEMNEGIVSGIENENAVIESQGSEIRLPVGDVLPLEYQIFKDGGVTSMESPRAFLKSLKLSALPTDARKYVREQLLEDEELDTLTMDDESIRDLKNLIETKYPDAIIKPVSAEPTAEDAKDTISGLEMLLSDATGEEKQQLTDTIEGLKLLL